MKGKTGIVYEGEEMYLGPAKFYVTDKRWAVSKVGLFADRTGKLDIEGTRAEVTGSREGPELFRTARMCPGSLRYYGLGLVNGNYTVTLHFAEIGFPNRNSQKWAGLARRIFDIYIQVIVLTTMLHREHIVLRSLTLFFFSFAGNFEAKGL